MRIILVLSFFFTFDVFALSHLDCRDHKGNILYDGLILEAVQKPSVGEAALFEGLTLNFRKYSFAYMRADEKAQPSFVSYDSAPTEVEQYAQQYMTQFNCRKHAQIFTFETVLSRLSCASFKISEIPFDSSIRFIDRLNEKSFLDRLSPGVRCIKVISIPAS